MGDAKDSEFDDFELGAEGSVRPVGEIFPGRAYIAENPKKVAPLTGFFRKRARVSEARIAPPADSVKINTPYQLNAFGTVGLQQGNDSPSGQQEQAAADFDPYAIWKLAPE